MNAGSNSPSAVAIGTAIGSNGVTVKAADATNKTAGDDLAAGDHIVAGTAGITVTQADTGGVQKSATFAEVRTDDNAFVKGETYVLYALGDSNGNTATAGSDAAFIKAAATNVDGTAISGTLAVGQKFTVSSTASTEAMAAINSLIDDMEFTKATETLTKDIEAVQAKVNTARVQAGSQYAALESAVDYTTDLTAQYELGFNTVNDVNFSMETAHLAKNQILQQAATAMLAQANQGQQSLLQLIQG
jgi:flagellin